MKGKQTKLGMLLILVGLLVQAYAFSQDSAPVDRKLQAVYQRIRFDRMYPPEAVAYIRSKVDNAERAIDVLAELSKDDRADVRALVAVLVGELGESEGAKILWPMIQDDTEFVRVTTAGAIVRLAALTSVTPSWAALKDERPEVRRLAIATLNQLGDKSAESALIEASGDPDELVRAEATGALTRCGTKASVPTLVERLHDESVLVRTAAAGALGVLADPSLIPVLIKALDDPDWHVRAQVVMTLSAAAGADTEFTAQVIEPIAAKLQDEYALVRDRAADVLARPKDEKAIAALVRAIVSEHRDARFHAHEAIIRSKAASALPQLMEHRNHANPEVREKIIRIFGRIGGPEQVAPVIEALNDKDSVVRLAAVEALRKMEERGAIDTLKAMAADPDAHVRARVARTMGDLGDRSAVPKLVELLRDPNGFVRGAAAEALGKLGDRSATHALIEVLVGERPPEPTPGAEELVIGTGASMLPEIAKLKEIEDKIKAVQALGEIRDPLAVDPIVEHGLKAEDAGLRAESAVSLGKIGERRAVGPLQDAVRPYYEAVPEDTEGVIAAGPIDERARQMKEREARVRASVSWALGQLGDPAAKQILIRAADDENSLVRDAAIEALAKIVEREERLAAGTVAPR